MNGALHALPPRIQQRIRVESDHIAFDGLTTPKRTAGGYAQSLAYRLVRWGIVVGIVCGFIYGNAAEDGAALALSFGLLLLLCFVGVRADKAPTNPADWIRLPLRDLELRIVETATRGTRHVAYGRSLVAKVDGQDTTLMYASGLNEDYDQIPTVAQCLKSLAAQRMETIHAARPSTTANAITAK